MGARDVATAADLPESVRVLESALPLQHPPMAAEHILQGRAIGITVTAETFRALLRAEHRAEVRHAEAMEAQAETNRLLAALVDGLNGKPARKA